VILYYDTQAKKAASREAGDGLKEEPPGSGTAARTGEERSGFTLLYNAKKAD